MLITGLQDGRPVNFVHQPDVGNNEQATNDDAASTLMNVTSLHSFFTFFVTWFCTLLKLPLNDIFEVAVPVQFIYW